MDASDDIVRGRVLTGEELDKDRRRELIKEKTADSM